VNADRLLDLLGEARGVVAIDGPSGAGKSTLARGLAAELRAAGYPVALVSTDFYATWDNPVAWWPTMETEVLGPLLRGHHAYPRPLIWPDGDPTPGPEVRISTAPLVILEGVSSARRSFADRTDLALWLDGPDPATRLERAVARDGERARAQLHRWQEFERGWFAVDRTRERCLPVST
jgi:uridine kinase